MKFHSQGQPGKLEITPTKTMATQRDLSLAYSPGVAVPVKVISENPQCAYDYTSKGNLVTIISNGTAILGSGPINLIHSALANFVSEQAQSCRKYEYFQGFATYSETKFAVPFGFSEEGPSGKK